MNLSRRGFVQGSLFGAASALVCDRSIQAPLRAEERSDDTPPAVLHQTDLFHPHCDPDDHFDLAVLFALAQKGWIDPLGVILDYPPADGAGGGDPAIAALAQLNRICARAVPGVVGSSMKMTSTDDCFANAPARELAAVKMILETLRRSEKPVRFKAGSSAPDIAVATLREPDLFREKCAGIYLNCGSAFPNPERPDQVEYNITVNPAGQAALFNKVPCPVYWFPCWHTTLNWRSGGYSTYFSAPHEVLLEGVSPAFRNFMYYMFSRSADLSWLRFLDKSLEERQWLETIRSNNGGSRALWATASLLMIAGRTVTRDGEIVSSREVDPEAALFRLENIKVHADERGAITWSACEEDTGRKIFHVLDDERYPSAMAKAVNTLFREFE